MNGEQERRAGWGLSGERGQEEEQDSHYHSGLRCLVFCPSLIRRLCASVLVWRKRACRSPVACAEITCLSSFSPGGEGEQRPQHPRPPSLCARIPGPRLPGEGKRLQHACIFTLVVSPARPHRHHRPHHVLRRPGESRDDIVC